MADQRPYTVLVSLDGGKLWASYERTATSPDGAINAVRHSNVSMREQEKQANEQPPQVPEPLYHASADFRPKRMALQLIEKWALTPVEAESDAGAD